MRALPDLFSENELEEYGKTRANIISLTYGTNGTTGETIVRAVLDDGRTLVRSITRSGVESEEIVVVPEIHNIEQRNRVIKELSMQNRTQVEIAAMLGISQSTVSNVLRK